MDNTFANPNQRQNATDIAGGYRESANNNYRLDDQDMFQRAPARHRSVANVDLEEKTELKLNPKSKKYIDGA